MKERLRRIAKFVGYPLGYLFLLLFFFYLTFPMDALRSRIVAEFERQQRLGRPPGEPVMTLEIGELDTYWFTGIELEKLKLTVPPKVEKAKPAFPGLDTAKDAPPPQPSVVAIDRFRARVRLLPLFAGRILVDFRMDAFGGTVKGSAPYASKGNVEIELEGVRLEAIEPLRAMVQNQPIAGVLHGSMSLEPEDGKFAKANGKVDLQVDEVTVFDGKSKLFGVALPTAQIGHIALVAKAEKGQLTIEELSVQGKDLELSGEGKVRLNESYKRSTADLFLKFKFTDAYRDKDDATRSLLGKPGAKFKPLIEEVDPQRTFVRAKTDDEFYRFHLAGRLDKLDVQPAGSGGGAGGAKRGGGKLGFGDAKPAGVAPRAASEGGEERPASGGGDGDGSGRGPTQAIPPGLLGAAKASPPPAPPPAQDAELKLDQQ